MRKKIIFIDTETTGLSPNKDEVIQIGLLYGTIEELAFTEEIRWNQLIKPTITEEIDERATEVHGYTVESLQGYKQFKEHAGILAGLLCDVDVIVGHNISYDMNMIAGEYNRLSKDNSVWFDPKLITPTLQSKEIFCTMKTWAKAKKVKRPKLDAIYLELIGEGFEGAHDAMNDILATKSVFIEMCKQKLFII